MRSCPDTDLDAAILYSKSKKGKFLKKLWCCVGGSITR